MPSTSENPEHRPSSPGRLQPGIGLVALSAVIVGVVLLAGAAFVLSYPGIHRIALQAGVSTTLAVLYPLTIDALLVSAGACLLSMRNAGWWSRCYVWLCLLLLLAVAGTGSAVHAMGLALPRQPTRAGVAATPWVLLLLGFGLWLVMLRYLRQARRAMREAARAGVNGGSSQAPTSWAGGSSGDARLPAQRGQLDALLGHREGPAPAIAVAGETPVLGAERPADTLALPAEPATEAMAGHDGGDYPGLAGSADTARYTHTAQYGLIAEYPPGAPGGYSPYDLDAGYPADLEEAQELTCSPPAGHAAESPETMPGSPYGEYDDGAPMQGEDSPEEGGTHGKPAAAGDQDTTEPPSPAPRFDRVRSTPTPPDE